MLKMFFAAFRSACSVSAAQAPEGSLSSPVPPLGMPADAAPLGGEAGVYSADSPASFCRFAGEDLKELPPPHVVNLPAQVALAGTLHVQVFVADEIVLRNELLGLFVVQLEALPRRLAVQLGDPLFGLLPAVAAPLLARHLCRSHALG